MDSFQFVLLGIILIVFLVVVFVYMTLFHSPGRMPTGEDFRQSTIEGLFKSQAFFTKVSFEWNNLRQRVMQSDATALQFTFETVFGETLRWDEEDHNWTQKLRWTLLRQYIDKNYRYYRDMGYGEPSSSKDEQRLFKLYRTLRDEPRINDDEKYVRRFESLLLDILTEVGIVQTSDTSFTMRNPQNTAFNGNSDVKVEALSS